MKTGAMLAATLLTSMSLPLLAQQPAPASPSQPSAPPASAAPSSSASPSTSAAPQAQAAPAPTAPAANLRPVQVELVQKLDSKTAKNGDSVIAQTRSVMKAPDGTEIPKGSRLIGHILAVQPSNANAQNSQVALKFDQIEIKGGQSLSIQSQIESITPAGGETASAQTPGAPMSAPQSAGTASSAPRAGASPQGSASPAPSAASPSAAPGAAAGAAAPPAAGTVVAQNGGINITTTAIPGVLLANNAPGQQDPRMARVSSILLGARRDIELDTGTQMVVDFAPSAAGQ